MINLIIKYLFFIRKVYQSFRIKKLKKKLKIKKE